MTIAILSDLHLGDPACSLVTGSRGARRTTADYQRLVTALRDAARDGIDYLVLLGDALDLAVASHGDSYDAAGVFFRALSGELSAAGTPLVKEIIYTLGNHDYPVWSTVMHQANVVNRLEGRQPVVDRWASPGILDFRASAGAARGRIYLPKVTGSPQTGYGGLYLDALTRIDGRPPLVFNVMYPNLYVITDRQSTLLTHGHYFDAPWAISAAIVQQIAQGDLKLGRGNTPSIEEIVALNLPAAELTSASLGMAGPLVPLVRAIQREYKDKDRQPPDAQRAPTIRKYLHRLRDLIDDRVLTYHWLKEVGSDAALDKAEGYAVDKLLGSKAAVHDDDFPDAGWVQGYARAVDLEREMLAREHGVAIPEITNLVCAHSHHYIAWGSKEEKLVSVDGHTRPLTICNTGGWLRARPEQPMEGGVFVLRDGVWSSTVLR
jgi:hypothetical protein